MIDKLTGLPITIPSAQSSKSSDVPSSLPSTKNSTVQGSLQIHNSIVQGSQQTHNSIVQGSQQTHISTVQGSQQTHISTVQGSQQIHNSITPQICKSTVQRASFKPQEQKTKNKNQTIDVKSRQLDKKKRHCMPFILPVPSAMMLPIQRIVAPGNRMLLAASMAQAILITNTAPKRTKVLTPRKILQKPVKPEKLTVKIPESVVSLPANNGHNKVVLTQSELNEQRPGAARTDRMKGLLGQLDINTDLSLSLSIGTQTAASTHRVGAQTQTAGDYILRSAMQSADIPIHRESRACQVSPRAKVKRPSRLDISDIEIQTNEHLSPRHFRKRTKRNNSVETHEIAVCTSPLDLEPVSQGTVIQDDFSTQVNLDIQNDFAMQTDFDPSFTSVSLLPDNDQLDMSHNQTQTIGLWDDLAATLAESISTQTFESYLSTNVQQTVSTSEISIQTQAPGLDENLLSPSLQQSVSTSEISIQTQAPGLDENLLSPSLQQSVATSEISIQTQAPGLDESLLSPSLQQSVSTSEISIQTQAPGLDENLLSPSLQQSVSPSEINIQTQSVRLDGNVDTDTVFVVSHSHLEGEGAVISVSEQSMQSTSRCGMTTNLCSVPLLSSTPTGNIGITPKLMEIEDNLPGSLDTQSIESVIEPSDFATQSKENAADQSTVVSMAQGESVEIQTQTSTLDISDSLLTAGCQTSEFETAYMNIETQTMGIFDQFLTNMHTQTSEDFFSDLGFSDTQTQTLNTSASLDSANVETQTMCQPVGQTCNHTQTLASLLPALMLCSNQTDTHTQTSYHSAVPTSNSTLAHTHTQTLFPTLDNMQNQTDMETQTLSDTLDTSQVQSDMHTQTRWDDLNSIMQEWDK